MEILRYSLLLLVIIGFTFSAFVIREDVRKGRNTKAATFVFCLAMAMLVCIDWF